MSQISEDSGSAESILQPIGTWQGAFEQSRREGRASLRTGFRSLDAYLRGGLRPDLYIMAADTGTGKSAIASVIAQNIAETGADVLYFALEMSRTEFIARGISAISFEQHLAASGRGKEPVAYGDIMGERYDRTRDEFVPVPYESYRASADEYFQRYGTHLYIVEGSTKGLTAEEIDRTVKSFRKDHGNGRLAVFVDYLQLLSADKDDPVQKDPMTVMSSAVRVLKVMATEEDAPVFLISSRSNAARGGRISEAGFKYSGDIAYTGGVLLGWNWDDVTDTADAGKRALTISEAKRNGFRKMSLEIIKQRSGERDESVRFRYYPAYNFLAEC